MPALKFPLDQSQSVGRFWLAGADHAAAGSDGLCRVDGHVIEVEVVSPLTEWMEEVASAPGVFVPRAEENDLVIHGSLPMQPGPVTFLGGRTVKRSVHNDVPSSDDSAELHVLRADWCVAGAHIDGQKARFSGVRARFTHLELWARTSELKVVQRTAPPVQTTMTYTPDEAPETPFLEFEEDGRLRVSTFSSVGAPGPWGSQIELGNWLELDHLSGWTLEEAFTRFVRPIQVLLTLLAGEECAATHFEVQVDGRWCAVYGRAVHSAATRPRNERLLLDNVAMPLDLLARWCEVANRLSPAPHVTGSSVAGEFATLDAEALALTTTAEGMDRVLYPEARRFDENQVSESIEALKSSEVPDDVARAMIDALRLYFYEDTYPTRMQRLAESLVEAAPRCVGRPNRWKREIANLRNGLAHSLDRELSPTDDSIRKMNAQVRSLRWAILLRLLLEVGVEAETLAAALGASRRFQRDERMWRAWLPQVFQAPVAGGPTSASTPGD